jgi:hypothetical protein
VDLIRAAASPLEAASRLISGKLSADDPKRTLTLSAADLEMPPLEYNVRR